MIIIIYLIVMMQLIPIRAKEYYPDNLSIQYAGNMGFISLGIGYDFFDDKFKTEVFYGYLPKKIAGLSIHTMSFKINYYPYSFNISKHYKIKPLMGILTTHTFGDKYFLRQPKHYPENYYRANSIHFNPFLGISLISKDKRYIKLFDSIEYYTEISVVDMYLRDYLNSVFDEHNIKFRDVVNISFGFKLYF